MLSTDKINGVCLFFILFLHSACEKYFHGSRYIFYESNGTQYNWDGSKKICNECLSGFESIPN